MLTPIPPTECSRARESMSAQLDGELSELGSARLSAHLRDCPACGAYALELATVTSRLRTAPLEQPERPIALPQRRRPIRVTARVAAAAVAVAAGASLALGNLVGHSASRAPAAVRAPIPTSVVRGLRADRIAVPDAGPTRARRMGRTVIL
jgi:predicted anti-sigma-YlaC factor YlaD